MAKTPLELLSSRLDMLAGNLAGAVYGDEDGDFTSDGVIAQAKVIVDDAIAALNSSVKTSKPNVSTPSPLNAPTSTAGA